MYHHIYKYDDSCNRRNNIILNPCFEFLYNACYNNINYLYISNNGYNYKINIRKNNIISRQFIPILQQLDIYEMYTTDFIDMVTFTSYTCQVYKTYEYWPQFDSDFLRITKLGLPINGQTVDNAITTDNYTIIPLMTKNIGDKLTANNLISVSTNFYYLKDVSVIVTINPEVTPKTLGTMYIMELYYDDFGNKQWNILASEVNSDGYKYVFEFNNINNFIDTKYKIETNIGAYYKTGPTFNDQSKNFKIKFSVKYNVTNTK